LEMPKVWAIWAKEGFGMICYGNRKKWKLQ
jgi:hypothetical protein